MNDKIDPRIEAAQRELSEHMQTRLEAQFMASFFAGATPDGVIDVEYRDVTAAPRRLPTPHPR